MPIYFEFTINFTKSNITLQQVVKHMINGRPEGRKNIAPNILPYYNRKDSLSVVEGCTMFNTRAVVPESFRQKILNQLHRGHLSSERSSQLEEAMFIGLTSTSTSKTMYEMSTSSKEPSIDYAGLVKGKYYLVIIDSY